MGVFRNFVVTAGVALVSSQTMAIGHLADVEIVDRASGRVLPLHLHEGEAWVAGTPGAKYAIRLRNTGWNRVLAVISVDGVNVVSGQTAASAQTGYVYSPFERGEIAGWRKSDNEIAAFEFVASSHSYAERTGRPANVGVIGVALFRDKERVVHRREFMPAPQAAPAPLMESSRSSPQSLSKSSSEAAGAADSAKKLGTGHGEREVSQVTRVQFNRESDTPNEVIRIRYDSAENLIAMGVMKPKYAWRNPLPNAFPRDSYVPDPPAMR